MERQILLIGIGESGCKCIEAVSQKTKHSNINLTCLSVDTDDKVTETDSCVHVCSLARTERLYTIAKELPDEALSVWFPYDLEDTQNEFLKSIRMDNGTGLWRAKSLLQLACYMYDEDNKNKFFQVIDSAIVNPEDELEVYVVASLIGGTGSGLLLPLSLFIKNYIHTKHRKDIKISAFLIGSDIYEDCLSAEQCIKARANAYATLRELNAVNTITFNENIDVAERDAIRFKLGNESDPILGLLFDTNDPLFQNAAAAPFNSVNIMERQPGVRLVSAHIEMLADILASICKSTATSISYKNRKSRKSADAIFGSLLLTKVIYPKDSVVEYVAMRRLFETMSGEWLYLHSGVKYKLAQEVKAAIQYGTPMLNSDKRYRKLLAETADELLAYSHTALLGKQNDNSPDACAIDFSCTEYISALKNKINSYLCGEGYETFFAEKEVLEKEFATQNFFSKEKTSLHDAATKFNNILQTVYNESIDVFKAKKEDFLAELTCSAGELSITENVIRDGASALHPVYALTRLCLLHETLSETIDNAFEDKNYFASYPEVISDKYLYAKAVKNAKTKYAKGDAQRFIQLVCGDRALLSNRKEDKAVFVSDITDFLDRIIDTAVAQFLEIVRNEISKNINLYVSFFNNLEREKEDFTTAIISEQRKNNSESGTLVNIYAAEQDKACAYNSYMQGVATGEYKDIFSNEVLDGAEKFITSSENSCSPASFDDWIASLVEDATSCIKATDFYKQHLCKNILEVLISPSPKATAAGDAGVHMRKVFSIAQPSLKTMLYDNGDGVSLKTHTTVLLSDGIKAFLDANAETLKLRGVGADNIVENIFHAAGERVDAIEFSPEISDDCMYIRKNIENLCIYEIEFANENSCPPIGYASNEKALRVMKTQYTEMWNPYLFSNLQIGLPFISPQRQEQRLQQLSKALLFAHGHELLVPAVSGENGTVYKRFYAGMSDILFFEDNTISTEDISTLCRWLQSDGAPLNEWSDLYDNQLREDCDSLPIGGIGDIYTAAIYNAIKHCPTFNAMSALLPLALQLGESARSERLLRVGAHTLYTLCSSRLNINDHEFYVVYKQLEGILCENYKSLRSDENGDFEPLDKALVDRFCAIGKEQFPSFSFIL